MMRRCEKYEALELEFGLLGNEYRSETGVDLCIFVQLYISSIASN
jgi:hypothetical protein